MAADEVFAPQFGRWITDADLLAAVWDRDTGAIDSSGQGLAQIGQETHTGTSQVVQQFAVAATSVNGRPIMGTQEQPVLQAEMGAQLPKAALFKDDLDVANQALKTFSGAYQTIRGQRDLARSQVATIHSLRPAAELAAALGNPGPLNALWAWSQAIWGQAAGLHGELNAAKATAATTIKTGAVTVTAKLSATNPGTAGSQATQTDPIDQVASAVSTADTALGTVQKAEELVGNLLGGGGQQAELPDSGQVGAEQVGAQQVAPQAGGQPGAPVSTLLAGQQGGAHYVPPGGAAIEGHVQHVKEEADEYIATYDAEIREYLERFRESVPDGPFGDALREYLDRHATTT